MQYTERQRIAKAVAGWGAFGALVLRVVGFVERMKRPTEWQPEQWFRDQYGELGDIVFKAYSTADPFGINDYNAEVASRDYLACAERFMELWMSPVLYARVGGHGRIGMIVREGFDCLGLDERVFAAHVGRIADKIWWNGFALLWGA